MLLLRKKKVSKASFICTTAQQNWVSWLKSRALVSEAHMRQILELQITTQTFKIPVSYLHLQGSEFPIWLLGQSWLLLSSIRGCFIVCAFLVDNKCSVFHTTWMLGTPTMTDIVHCALSGYDLHRFFFGSLILTAAVSHSLAAFSPVISVLTQYDFLSLAAAVVRKGCKQ